MDRHYRPTAIIALIALLFATFAVFTSSPGGVPNATAQEATPSPVASPVSDATVTTLMERAISPLPTSPLTVRLLRITLEPGAAVPLHTHPGPEFDYVESGTLTVEVDGEAPIVRASGEEEDAPQGEAVALAAGDWISFPVDAGMAFSNQGDEPVAMLSAVLLPVGPDVASGIEYTNDEPTAEDFAGVSFTVLGDGLIESVPEGDGTLTVQQIEVPAGSPLPGDDNPVLISRIDGNMSFSVDGGSVQVTRTSDPGLRPDAVPGEEFSLATGDGAFFPQGLEDAARDGETEPLTAYRLILDPAEETTNEPATITILAPDEIDAAATPAATPQAETTDDGTGAGQPAEAITEGATVETIDENVRVRDEPTTGGEILRALPAGTLLTVIGSPEEADDFVWYPVEVADDEEGLTGWVAQDFIRVVEDGAEATPAD